MKLIFGILVSVNFFGPVSLQISKSLIYGQNLKGSKKQLWFKKNVPIYGSFKKLKIYYFFGFI